MSFSDRVLIIGHRGAAGLSPENTLPSFRRAWALGVNAVELDVHLVEDELVVIHDDTLERTTNGQGPVAGRSLAALRGLDAGGGWPIPLLREVVAALPAGAGLNVELKGAGTAAAAARYLSGLPGVDLLASSFDHDELVRFHDLAPNVPVAPLYDRWRDDVWETAAELGAWSVNLSRRAVTAERVQEAARRGLAVLVYTVNDLNEAGRLIGMGVRGVFTDYPDRITLAALADRAPAAGDSARP
ncbi:MAG: glycerophosphodiester phosphodiesterase family protein [Pseudomonadales bacterium]